MKQNDSKYHLLYLELKNADDYFPKEDRKELLDLIKELYDEHNDLLNKDDDNGKYGIRYKTIEEDSRWPDSHTQFFSSKEKRDNVYDDWINNRYWDSVFEDYLEYPTPGPNINEIEKIFKESDKIYIEQ